MEHLKGHEAAERLAGLIHGETQISELAVDLTLARVHAATGPGALDFGGSELAEAPREPLEPVPDSPDEEYGWWQLGPGTYPVTFNESVELAAGELGRLEPHPRLIAAGCQLPTLSLLGTSERVRSLLTVGTGGARLKENCRLARFTVLRVA